MAAMTAQPKCRAGKYIHIYLKGARDAQDSQDSRTHRRGAPSIGHRASDPSGIGNHHLCTTFAPPWPQLPLFTHMLRRAKYGSVLVIYMSQCRPLQITHSMHGKKML
ncbi:uncharacterized protein LOC26535404 [Drosophila yakuba]|uniref:Uncharacterized protein n=1 Tax=Drosophila yakuba TaxID=7245 RepID=A0A0R1DNI8_DROYA|nr:uncharacterized protein LOC26535404 [Drosophila yakuba]KRJ97234.1 uncharacterized protein Dyak_GE28223 [Drosophila yakuba]